jgi:hypothetical protein
MTERFAPPTVIIRRYPTSRICDVLVVVRGQEMVIRCPSYSQAVRAWNASRMVFLNRSIFRTTGSPTMTCRFFCAQIEIELTGT